jgi:hypothetical protein
MTGTWLPGDSVSATTRAADYVEQAQVTNWPARVALVAVMLAIIALALWGMRRGWLNRARRQADVTEPADAPPPGAELVGAVEGLFAGTGTHGDWMDRIVVFDLGVRSRATISWGPRGIWLERLGARSLFIPAEQVVSVRTDRGVAGTVRGKDSMVVVTWRLGDRVLDTGFRADASPDHATVLDGLVSTFAAGVE